MLVDTDVMIDYLRGFEVAVNFLEQHVDDLRVSAITVAELYQGVREGKERTKLSMVYSISNLHIYPIISFITLP